VDEGLREPPACTAIEAGRKTARENAKQISNESATKGRFIESPGNPGIAF
jgi:hypothetical protein